MKQYDRPILPPLNLLLGLWLGCTAFAQAQDDAWIHLGQPCRAKQVLGGTTFHDPKSGAIRFALCNMNEVSGGELILIDPDANTAELFRMPAGAGSWNVRPVPQQRLVIGTFYDGTFLTFDLKARSFVGSKRFASEEYIWNTATGPDGRIYGGTYPGGRLGALNLDSNEVEDCGAPAAPNLYLNLVSTTHDGRLLCSFSTANPIQKLYSPATRTWQDVPESLKGVTAGVAFNGQFVAGGGAYTGTNFTPTPPAFPIPGPGWSVEAALSTSQLLILRQNNAIFSCRTGSTELRKLADFDLRGGRYLAVTDDGQLFGVRGQDYFRIRPGQTELELRAIPTESAARNLLFLRADPEGRLWSGPPFGQTLSVFDPRSRTSLNTRTICDAGGEVFDVAFHHGQVFAVTYAGGDIVAYDPGADWDQWNQRNPRTIASIGARGYIRPVGGALMGPGGKLYSGWMAKYGTYGGAIAVTEPRSGATDLIENPLGSFTISTLATDGQFLYAGSDRSANGLPPKPDGTVRFGVIDPETRATLFSLSFTNAARVASLVVDPTTRTGYFTVDATPHRFHTGTNPAPERVEGVIKVGSRNLVLLENGQLLLGQDKNLVRFDPSTQRLEPLATLPKRIESIAVGKDRQVFVSSGPDLYSVKDRSSSRPQ